MQYCVKFFSVFLATSVFMCAGNASGRDNTELRIIKISRGNGASICATVQSALSPDGKIKFDQKSNLLVVVDRPDYLPHIEELVRSLDIRVPHVEISVRIAEVNGRFLQKAGIFSRQTIFSRGSFIAVRGLLNSAGSDSVIRSETTVKSFSGTSALLQVSAVEIFGTAEVKDAGAFLEVLPTVNDDDTITVKLRPSVFRVIEGAEVPESRALTQVTLHSGDTLVMGDVDTQAEPAEASGRRKAMIFLTADIGY